MAKKNKIRASEDGIVDEMPPPDLPCVSAADDTGEHPAMTVETGEAEATGDDAQTRKGKKSRKKDKAAKDAVGSNKAVDTMFRNAYRAELDTIALAATKANIMISLNGFIISALMISGAFIFASSPAFLVPAAVFMLTAALSIVFALLSASPERAGLWAAIWAWLKDFLRRRASLGDLRRAVLQARKPEPTEEINLLIYEERMRLSRGEYLGQMNTLMQDRERVYGSMSDQLYWLGAVADRKFRLLDVSYSVFRWGLLFSVIAFAGVKLVLGIVPPRVDPGIVRLSNVGIGEFEDIYEPSAVQQLPDGRLLVVEDEAVRAINILTFAEDGSLAEDNVTDLKLMRGFGRPLNDLEGLSMDDNQFVYAVTSHSLTNDGARNPDREQLLRFRIVGGAVGEIGSFTTLREAIARDALLTEAVQAETGEPINLDDLNIEGLAYYRQADHLYLGLRGPLVGDRSMILVIQNPGAVFDGSEPPRFGPPIILDLQGGGIRALSYDPVLGTFLIVNEIEGYEGNRYSQLWSWNGDPAVAPEPIALPDIINLNNVESIDSIVVNGEPRLLIMSDEGSEKKNEPARYMMLNYDQIAN